MNEEVIRKLPFSMIAEQSLLGSILIDPESFNLIADVVGADDFYISEHTQIFHAMRDLYMSDNEIDIVTLIDRLVAKGIYDKSGGEDYIRTIGEVVPSALNVKDYAKIVKEKSLLRKLISVCGDISDSAYSEQDAVEFIIENAEQKIFDIAEKRETKNFVHIRDALMQVYDHLHLLTTDKEATQGVATGFKGLDGVLAGMGKSDLIIVGARPGMGKTSFVLNVGTNVARATGKTVCIFSLEMSAEQLVTRVVSSEAMIESKRLRTGELSPEDWDSMAHTAEWLSKCNILIDDTAGITVTGMKSKLRRVDNLGLVVIDYLQLMQGDRRSDNRAQEVSEISRSIKLMAKELRVPILCCAQLNRAAEKNSDKRPMLSDLRDSGSIEQDADAVLFLYRSEYYQNDNGDEAAPPPEAGTAEVIIAKNRHGSTTTVKVGWIGKYTKFRSIEQGGTGGA
ncbi:MAG: replicative DNA helicase [Clostridia bacterium]|nr:replicative DNA helicase [Clostridia bacterium]